jgi:Fic family protein
MAKNKFSPQYLITNKMLSQIRQIGEVIGEIKSKKLSKNNLIKLKNEARALSTFASTSIEGNPLPLTDVKIILKNAPNQIRNSEKEILNYNNALEFIYLEVKKAKFILSSEIINKTQKLVISNLMDDKEDIGKYRKKAVIIRNPKKPKEIAFIPPNFQDVAPLMRQLIDFVNFNKNKIDPIILAGIFHKQNVIIHHFMDGNGRTTRLITTAILGANGFDFFDIFSLENYYNQNVSKYFENVGVFGDFYEIQNEINFTNWLEYFIEGILEELKRVQKTLPNFTKEIRLENHHKEILKYLEKHGSISQKEYEKFSTRSLASRKNDFKKLINLNLIKTKQQGKATYYVKV